MEKSSDLCSRFHPNKQYSSSRHLLNDRISSLPNEVLFIILSFLPLKEMVMTSTLSTRWLNLWANTHVLDFQLDFALARKVESLELDFSSFAGVSLNLADSKSRVLQFNAKFLKSLSLKNANVTSEAVDLFLRNCVFLERLEVVGSVGLVNLVISDPNLVLKYLQIRDCRLCEFLTISNFNLVSLDTTVEKLFLTDLPMLVELSVGKGMAVCDNVLWHTLSPNATCLRRLESLKLCTNHRQAIIEVSSILAQLTKLKRLAIDYIGCVDEPMLGFLCVIERCTHLEEFVLELRSSVGVRGLRLNSIEPERKNLGKLNGLGSLSLKVFEFKGYNGCAGDFELMMNLVMNAPLLEKIIIDGNVTEKRVVKNPVRDARRLALKQIEELREVKLIPPHVIVIIR